MRLVIRIKTSRASGLAAAAFQGRLAAIMAALAGEFISFRRLGGVRLIFF